MTRNVQKHAWQEAEVSDIRSFSTEKVRRSVALAPGSAAIKENGELANIFWQ